MYFFSPTSLSQLLKQPLSTGSFIVSLILTSHLILIPTPSITALPQRSPTTHIAVHTIWSVCLGALSAGSHVRGSSSRGRERYACFWLTVIVVCPASRTNVFAGATGSSHPHPNPDPNPSSRILHCPDPERQISLSKSQ